ncbi:RluA family pseudouridine synthase [Candidatus Wolfebacteria bacterium CG18_big_fil_WC_8_21_14_2_50_39_7]|uniref:RluA family pseudouridine synthase n=3 Tax=Candidatus Wolfeibacteriota TaxID=1752735 RepID=A0A2M7Q7X7_9BACT|nr:RluA family pseudouridine synthase [Parcubacteria group bacterium]NCO89311.1 RluA family pseudouridine synthase [Candidatus Wolfebacteria bacterium]PIP92081.1 MAG: RluA family pseudouridine synthase [Candidatus Wolfebacteria bacterium CG18_big_fil_WC_8_21_14_2_50_39_7]PIY59175.1 MAG: RluA family pseudouridine synthase [Candidatus Wolfebacteria bacterium CG_4_10_14_0_8_um_filter_39_64]PJB83475.1 MAG: RluA family pseudouridine synthase [Candidatus Wolfebacteria bacterium CG_4_9_14_0_8_um_filte
MKEQITPIYEDKNFLAVYKPAGLLVHPAKLRIKNAELRTEERTLTDWALKKYPEIKSVGDPSTSSGQTNLRPGIVHRLDRDTSGVILIARNQKYFEYLKNLFQTRQIKKNYLALVYGKLEPKFGVIKKPIRLKSGTTKRTVWQGKMEKEAITEYKVLKYFKYNKPLTIVNKLLYFSFVRVMPKTGRTHQIRVHLASTGHPVVGDLLYGPKKNPLGLKRLFLHAESLEFSLENGRRIKIESGLPEELKLVLKRLTNK